MLLGAASYICLHALYSRTFLFVLGFGITLSEVWGLLLALYSRVTPRMRRGLCSAGKRTQGSHMQSLVPWYHVYLCPALYTIKTPLTSIHREEIGVKTCGQ